MNYPACERQPLSENERNDLGKAIIGFGNLRQTAQKIGISTATIRHAVAGFNINPDVRKKIRKYLKSQIIPA